MMLWSRDNRPAFCAGCLGRVFFPLLAASLWLVIAVMPVSAATAVRIGVILDGPGEDNEPLLELFQQEILALTEGEFAVVFAEDRILTADWSREGVEVACDRLLADSEVDLVLALGALASHDLARRGPLNKPALAPFTIDRSLQEFPLTGETSGVDNFSYLAFPSPIERDLKLFSELLPFRRLAVLVNRAYLDGIPALRRLLQNELAEQGIEMVPVPVTVSAREALEALPEGIEAVYVTPLQRLPQQEFELLVDGLKERNLPSFSYLGHSEVVRGLLAGAATEASLFRLARRTALAVQSVLLGRNPAELPVFGDQQGRLMLNMATADAIGFSPNWEQYIEAERIATEPVSPARSLTLAETVREALQVNLDLAAFDRQLAAGEAEVRKARSALLPQLAVVGQGLVIDGDRAEAALGRQAERTLTGGLVLEHSLYAESRHAGYRVRQEQQRGRLQEQRQLQLDIAQAAASGYLDVLRAKTLKTIQVNNLRLTRSNLDLARRRHEIGFSGPAEVYRWESQLAQDRAELVRASTRRSLAEMALNRLLQRPAEEPFTTAEVRLDDPDIPSFDGRLADYLDTPAAFARYRDFLVGEGLAEVPELQRLDRAIAGAERLRLAARRSFVVPDLSLRADLSHRFSESGKGVDSPLDDFLPVALPRANDTDWSVGLNLTLPLFSGGGRTAELRQAEAELERLRTERRALADRIEQRIRSALQLARSSHTGIGLARQGTAAAGKNLELVTDAYARGVVSIIELIDAQNAALAAEQVSANALYDYFIDLMEVQRAVGRFDWFVDSEKRRAWFHRLEDFRRQESVPASLSTGARLEEN